MATAGANPIGHAREPDAAGRFPQDQPPVAVREVKPGTVDLQVLAVCERARVAFGREVGPPGTALSAEQAHNPQDGVVHVLAWIVIRAARCAIGDE